MLCSCCVRRPLCWLALLKGSRVYWQPGASAAAGQDCSGFERKREEGDCLRCCEDQGKIYALGWVGIGYGVQSARVGGWVGGWSVPVMITIASLRSFPLCRSPSLSLPLSCYLYYVIYRFLRLSLSSLSLLPLPPPSVSSLCLLPLPPPSASSLSSPSLSSSLSSLSLAISILLYFPHSPPSLSPCISLSLSPRIYMYIPRTWKLSLAIVQGSAGDAARITGMSGGVVGLARWPLVTTVDTAERAQLKFEVFFHPPKLNSRCTFKRFSIQRV